MSRLSEKQLLLLDNLMYCEGMTTDGHSTLGSFVDYMRASPKNFGKLSGFLDDDQFMRILDDISKDKTLMSLQIGDSHRDNKSTTDGWSATSFINPANNEVTVAFRGTGGTYEAWFDNLEGAGNANLSPMQASVVEWIESLGSKNITVTGHSKGGNLAQVATVLCPDLISYCVSYDGQGFSEEFISKYEDEISVASKKIKSISAYNDYVNILMFPIAGEEVFVNNNSEHLLGGHFSYNLLSDNEFDEEGNFTSFREQSPGMKVLSELNKALLRLLPLEFEEVFTDVLGAFVGVLATRDEEDIPKALDQLLDSLIEFLPIYIGYKVEKMLLNYLLTMYPILGAAYIILTTYFEHKSEIDAIIKKMENLCQQLLDAAEFYSDQAREQIQAIVNLMIEAIKDFYDYFSPSGRAGRAYVMENPYFKIDTTAMRNYAGRIDSVNRRLKILDRDLNDLYLQVRLKDQGQILKVNIITSGSPTLKRVKAYLIDTAKRFEDADNKAFEIMGGN